jgi:hypothetical protein
VAVALGLVAVVGEGTALTVGTTTPGEGHFQHATDYWLTASALPHALAAITLLVSVRAMQGGRDGRRGLAGIVLAGISLAALAAVCALSLAVGHEVSGGPTYVLGTACAFVGHALFSAGSWRVGLLPRWLLAIWPVIWVIGSFAAVSASPALLGVLYIVIAVHLGRARGRATG